MSLKQAVKKTGFNFEWQNSESKNTNSSNDFLEMRDWQQRAFEQLKEAPFMILNAPMGSGKSSLMCWLSAFKMKRDDVLRSIIAVPQTIIAPGFADEKLQMPGGEKMHWQIENNLCSDTFGRGTVNFLIKWLERPTSYTISGRTILCTHSTLVDAYKKLKAENRRHIFNNVLLWVDEAHHVKNVAVEGIEGAVFSNGIGELVKYFVDNQAKNLQMGLTTASFFRGDRASLLTDDMEVRFNQGRFNLPYDEYLRSMKHLKSFSFDFLLSGHHYVKAIETVVRSRRGKDIIHIPHPISQYSTGRKDQEVRDIISIYGNISHITEDGVMIVVGESGEQRILDLVSEDLRKQKKFFLSRPALQKQSDALDAIIALGMFKEGANWIHADRSIIVGARTSLVDVIQMVGRLFRDTEGKSHVEVIQILPFSLDQQDEDKFRENLNNYLKAIYASLILENILNPVKIKSTQKSDREKPANENHNAKTNWLNEVLPDYAKQQLLIDEVVQLLVDQNKETSNNKQLYDECKNVMPEILESYGINEHQEEVFEYICAMFVRPTLRINGINVENIDLDIVQEIHPLEFLRRYTSGVCNIDTFAKLREAIRLGRIEWRPFEEARAFVRNLKLKNWGDWVQWAQTSIRPNDIPSAPDKAYAGKGWIDWGDFLGTNTVASYKRKYRLFEEAKIFVQALGLKTEHGWRDWKKNNKLPTDIPGKPERTYANRGWRGWGDFLGTDAIANQNRKFSEFDKARRYVHSIGLKNKDDWSRWSKSGERPDDIPTNPAQVYANEGWVGWGDFLGTGNIASSERKFRSFEAARAFARSMLLKGKDDWFRFTKIGTLPIDIPVAPNSTYADAGWSGWKDWLGTGTNNPKLQNSAAS